jgi:hypothetical protein
MTTIRAWLAGHRQDPLALASWLRAGGIRLAAVWGSFEDHAQVQIIGLAFLALGFIVAGFGALALLVPGAVLTLVSLGFTLKRSP